MPDEVVVKIEDLVAVRDHILMLQSALQSYHEALTQAQIQNNNLRTEIRELQGELEKRKRGWWVGASSGYPFGVVGHVGYQFGDRFMVTCGTGYMGQFTVHAGFMARIGNGSN